MRETQQATLQSRATFVSFPQSVRADAQALSGT
jgi:hypothetical protein